MRIDAHQHFWRYDPGEYPWISEAMPALRRDFQPPDLAVELHAAGLDGSIAVQARQSLAETRWLLDLADRNPFLLGVVGWVDLRSPTVDEDLALFAGRPQLVGLRHLVQDEPDDAFLLRSDFRRGIGRLAHYGLVYDLLVFPRHLPAATALVAEFPEQRFVLDHLAKPPIRTRCFEPWAGNLRALARHPNVACKISGLVTEADWKTWTAADLRPYLDVALDAFGDDRLLFGSDWPVCLLAASYAAVAAVVDDWASGLPAGARARLFGDNAARIYLRR